MSTGTGFSTLRRPDGVIAYDVQGDGPLVVLVPGMGDLRATYRFVAPALKDAGYRVATTDLRGQGDSDPTFTTYGDVASADDILALIETLGGPAVVVGSSMGAAAATYAAAQRPDQVSALVLLGPFLRETASAGQRALLRLAMARPWARLTWKAYLPTLYAGQPAADQERYLARVDAALKRPGYTRAFSRLVAQLDHRVVEARLDDVRAAALVLMGDRDPDFPDPRAEADWIATRIPAEVTMVPDAGHYPQSQAPEAVTAAILGFLRQQGRHA